MSDLSAHERKILEVQKKLESWHSLIPQCVTMSYKATKGYICNNGELFNTAISDDMIRADH